MDILSIINSINWHTLNWDLYIIIIFIVGVIFYSFFLGKDRVFILLISSYISLALLSELPLFISTFNIQPQTFDSFINLTAFFIFCAVLLFFIISYSDFTSIFDKSPAGTLLQTLLISFLQIGLFVSVIVSFLSPEEKNSLSIFIKSIFIENQARAFWLLAPLLLLLFLKGRSRIY